MTSIKITRRWLRDMGACDRPRKAFARYYPEGVELTPKLLRKVAQRKGTAFDLRWLGVYLFGEQFSKITRRLDGELWAPLWAQREAAGSSLFLRPPFRNVLAAEAIIYLMLRNTPVVERG